MTPNHRSSRGFTMLLALGVILMLTLAVLLSLSNVTGEADIQASARRSKEAFFAAEAGMAEGREAMRLLLGSGLSYTPTFAALVAAPDIGDVAADPWYQVILQTPYQLSIDTAVTTADREATDRNGVAYRSYPNPLNVSYRVFVRDDVDDADPAVDTNRQVWLISVGEVQDGNGAPTRAVVQALITNTNTPPLQSGYSAQKGGDSVKSSSQTFDANAVDLTQGRAL